MVIYKKLSRPDQIVAHRRQELRLSQTELAGKLGYTNVNFISMVEGGKSKVPLERSIDFAEALEIDVKWFIEQVMRDRYPKVAEVLFKSARKS